MIVSRFKVKIWVAAGRLPYEFEVRVTESHVTRVHPGWIRDAYEDVRVLLWQCLPGILKWDGGPVRYYETQPSVLQPGSLSLGAMNFYPPGVDFRGKDYLTFFMSFNDVAVLHPKAGAEGSGLLDRTGAARAPSDFLDWMALS